MLADNSSHMVGSQLTLVSPLLTPHSCSNIKPPKPIYVCPVKYKSKFYTMFLINYTELNDEVFILQPDFCPFVN